MVGSPYCVLHTFQRVSVALINHKLFSFKYFQGIYQGPAFPLKWLPACKWPECFFALCLSLWWRKFRSQAEKFVRLHAASAHLPKMLPWWAAVEKASPREPMGLLETHSLPPKESPPLSPLPGSTQDAFVSETVRSDLLDLSIDRQFSPMSSL